MFEYNASLAITRDVRGNPNEKLYQELGLVQKTMLFYKICKNNYRTYLSNIVQKQNSAFNTRNVDKVPLFKIKHDFFKNSFFPSTVIEWNKLDPNFQNENNFYIFLSSLQFIRPTLNRFSN